MIVTYRTHTLPPLLLHWNLGTILAGKEHLLSRVVLRTEPIHLHRRLAERRQSLRGKVVAKGDPGVEKGRELEEHFRVLAAAGEAVNRANINWKRLL